MSRIGKKPIPIPKEVTVTLKDGMINVQGPKGVLTYMMLKQVSCSLADDSLILTVSNPDDRSLRAYWGLTRALIANMVEGVTKGYEKKLEVKGVGFKVAMQGKTLVLQIGFSHPVEFLPAEGVTVEVAKNVITVSGIDKQLVGETAANIRKLKKPEPYKGKGIRYVGELVRHKEGKVVKAGPA